MALFGARSRELVSGLRPCRLWPQASAPERDGTAWRHSQSRTKDKTRALSMSAKQGPSVASPDKGAASDPGPGPRAVLCAAHLQDRRGRRGMGTPGGASPAPITATHSPRSRGGVGPRFVARVPCRVRSHKMRRPWQLWSPGSATRSCAGSRRRSCGARRSMPCAASAATSPRRPSCEANQHRL